MIKQIKPALFVFAFLSFVSSTCIAQTTAPPGTDIFIADLSEQGGQVRISKPANITRRQGYDNQPGFTADGRAILYTSIREDKQADTYKHVFETGAATRVIATAESEYSPTITPDGKYFSVIRVEADSTQRLWKFPLAGGEPSLVLEKIKPVGYHLWVDAGTLILFVLGTPNTLQQVDAATEKSETIITSVGRSLRLSSSDRKVSFVHKVSADEWIIKELDIKTRKITSVIKTLAGSEDFARTRDGAFVMAKDSKFFIYNPSRDKDWREIADFSKEGVKGITRLAVSPKGDKIAFVASDAP